jgi:phosphatidylglycerol:prolipoprotein diacylglycerol transferase
MRHYWVDRLDPWFVHFYGPFGIRWYGIAYVAGIVLATWLIRRWVDAGRLPITRADVPTLAADAATGILIGGRLGYCLIYARETVLHDPLYVFEIWKGGMASHGGIIGLVVAMWWFARRRHLDPLIFTDVAAVTGPIGIALGRLANFVNGELWGRPATVPWAVIFPDAPPVDGVNVPRHPSQLYAALLEGALLFAIAQWAHARYRRPGLTTAAVCVAYGVVRFIDEFWREPDVGQPVYFGWLTKGQAFSLPMIGIGLALGIWCLTRPAAPREHESVVVT